MANDYYVHGTVPVSSSQMLSAPIRNEFDLVTAGFNKFPPLAAGAGNLVKTNSLGTALDTTGLLVLNTAFACGSTNGAVYSIVLTQQINGTFTLPPESATLSTYNSRAGYLYGLTVANNTTDATNDLDIAAGSCLSTDNTTIANRVVLTLSTALVKRLDATWVTGTNQGGRASSAALADGTWHVYMIRVAGVDDVGFDTSTTGANLVTDHGATHVRRIASVPRIAGAWQQFVQRDDTFLLKTIVSVTGGLNPGTAEVAIGPTANTYPTLIPQSDNWITFYSGIDNTGGSPATVYVYYRQSGGTDQAATEANHTSLISIAGQFGCRAMLKLKNTGTLGGVRHRLSASNATTRMRMVHTAWVDGRGRRRDI